MTPVRSSLSRTLRSLGVPIVLAAWAVGAWAQTEEPSAPMPLGPIVTDRPTQATAPIIQPLRTFQIEAGYDRNGTSQPGADVGEWTAPNLLLRYGVSERFELRLGGTGWIAEIGGDAGEEGLSDVYVSTKMLLVEERGARPQMGLLVDVSLPVGDQAVTSDSVDPTVVFLALNNLTDRLALTYNLGAGLVTTETDGDSERDVDVSWAAVLSGPVSGPVSLFGELYGSFPSGRDSENGLAAQAGVTILVSRRFQVDFRGGAGLAGDEPDWHFGLGLAWRLPR